MAERRSAVAPSVPPGAQACRRGVGVGAPQAARHRCICGGGSGGGCGLGLARLVGRLRRQGRRALCAAAAPPAAAARRRGCQCQYDPLSYARNFDLGGDGVDDDTAGVYYSYSFSSRFVLAPSSTSSAAAVSAPSGLDSRPVVTSH